MKRYPKRARPLWGRAKRRPVTRPEPRRILYFEVSGTDAQGVHRSERLYPAPDGSPVTTVGSYRSDVRMVAVVEPRIPKRVPITIGYSGDVSEALEVADAVVMRLDSPGGSGAGLTRAIHESGPRVSADGMTAGSIGARALSAAPLTQGDPAP